MGQCCRRSCLLRRSCQRRSVGRRVVPGARSRGGACVRGGRCRMERTSLAVACSSTRASTPFQRRAATCLAMLIAPCTPCTTVLHRAFTPLLCTGPAQRGNRLFLRTNAIVGADGWSHTVAPLFFSTSGYGFLVNTHAYTYFDIGATHTGHKVVPPPPGVVQSSTNCNIATPFQHGANQIQHKKV